MTWSCTLWHLTHFCRILALFCHIWHFYITTYQEALILMLKKELKKEVLYIFISNDSYVLFSTMLHNSWLPTFQVESWKNFKIFVLSFLGKIIFFFFSSYFALFNLKFLCWIMFLFIFTIITNYKQFSNFLYIHHFLKNGD